jgi:hypothetical protein
MTGRLEKARVLADVSGTRDDDRLWAKGRRWTVAALIASVVVVLLVEISSFVADRLATPIANLGTLIAGVASPIALLWLILGYELQRLDLRLQREEFVKSREIAAQQVAMAIARDTPKAFVSAASLICMRWREGTPAGHMDASPQKFDEPEGKIIAHATGILEELARETLNRDAPACVRGSGRVPSSIMRSIESVLSRRDALRKAAEEAHMNFLSIELEDSSIFKIFIGWCEEVRRMTLENSRVEH